jgi:glycosyltransferase involved in cell wall biosynthesis
VLLHAGVDLSRPGGVETHVRELARHLALRGHEVGLAGTPRPIAPYPLVLDPGDRGDRRDETVSRWDVVHQHGGFWPRGRPLPRGYVRTIHFCTAAKMLGYLRRGRMRTLLNPGNWAAVREERASCRRPGGVIVVSENVLQDCARMYGLDPARARVIPNGTAATSPARSRDAVRDQWGVPRGAWVVLTVGRQDYVKGLDLFARAWRASGLTERGGVWVSIGGGARDVTGGRRVLGDVGAQDVADWIHAADAGAVPSYYESGGIVLLDLQAAGRFTLAHDVGYAREVIREGETGRIVAESVPAWAAALRAAQAAPGPVPVRVPDRFRWDRIAAEVEAVYRAEVGS